MRELRSGSNANRRGRVGAALVAVAALVVVAAGVPGAAHSAASLPACTASTFAAGPGVGAVTLNQGVGSYAFTPEHLVRGKDTLVRFYLTLPAAVGTTCSGSISITGATMTVSNGSASLPPIASNQSYGTGLAVTSTTVSSNSAADPTFVLPGPRANSCLVDLSNGGACAADTSSGFTLAFTASVTYTTSAGTGGTLAISSVGGSPITAAYDRATNALRVLVIPMGDTAQTYSSQFGTTAQQAVQNGFATASRILPVPYGVSSELATPDTCGTPHRCGIVYRIDLSAMLNLRAVAGSYDSNGKFCGTQGNFDAIKGQLDTFLAAYNNNPANASHPADRVLGVVDANISDGYTVGCAEGMAAVSSSTTPQPTEAWVRAIPDKPATNKTNAVPSDTGALMAMELGHTLGLRKQTVDNLTWHSPLTAADATAPDRAFNISSRSWLGTDHTVMHFTKTTTDTVNYNNNDTVYEPVDFGGLLCGFGGLLAADCPTVVNGVNQITGVPAAAGNFAVISGDTDLTPGGTHVVESYGAAGVLQGLPDPNSLLRLVLLSGGLQIANIGVPYSDTTSDHHQQFSLNKTTAVFGGAFLYGGVSFDRIQLWSGDPNGGGTLLYSADAQAQPPEVEVQNFSPGGSASYSQTVQTKPVLPPADVYFLADTTGSMGPSLANVQSNAQSIEDQVKAATSDVRFGAGDYNDFTSCASGVTPPCYSRSDPAYAFNNAAPIPAADDGGAAARTAINAWAATGGGDRPEAQMFALTELAAHDATFDPHWRSASQKIAVWFGDNPGHDPICGAIRGNSDLPAITTATTAAALHDAGIEVIAVSVNSGEGSLGLDGERLAGDPDGAGFYAGACGDATNSETGQATAIVNATHGSFQSAPSAADVSNAIIRGLNAVSLPVTVTPSPTCSSGLSMLFDGKAPADAGKTVKSGEQVSFAETVNIAPTATPGATLTCSVDFLVGSTPLTGPDLPQQIAITVPTAPKATVTASGSDPSKFKAHLLYDCGNGEQLPAGGAMGLPPSSVSGQTAQWQLSFDATLQCANRTGPPQLTAFVTNGIQSAYSPTPTTVRTPRKSPTAAIYQPTQDLFLPSYKKLPLNGSVTDPEDGDLVQHWTIGGPGVSLTATGGPLDVAPPAAAWPLGDYTVTLTGTDADGNTATATSHFHVAGYTFSGFEPPVDNPPVLNLGTAGRTYPVKWKLTDAQSGLAVGDIAVVEGVRYATFQAPVAGCGSEPADPLETTATGGAVLRADPITGEYTYNWSTPGTPGCYVLSVMLNDGTTHVALFRLN